MHFFSITTLVIVKVTVFTKFSGIGLYSLALAVPPFLSFPVTQTHK